jgi:hypothetical protein
MKTKYQKSLVKVPDSIGRGNYSARKIDGNYFIWDWVEFSKAKTKRRRANKAARRQRKLNRK